MEISELNSYLAPWGAVLSTILASIKIWEFWRDSFRIDISHNFTDNPEIGNEIHIRNLSAKPIILGYWELSYVSGYWPFRRFHKFDCPDPYTTDTQILPHSTKTLTFKDESHFSWGTKFLNGRKIYMRLYIVGRRPVLEKLYG